MYLSPVPAKVLKDYPTAASAAAAFHAMIALMAEIESWSSSFKSGSGWRSGRYDLSEWALGGPKPIQIRFCSWPQRPLKLAMVVEGIRRLQPWCSWCEWPAHVMYGIIYSTLKKSVMYNFIWKHIFTQWGIDQRWLRSADIICTRLHMSEWQKP